MPLRHWTTIFLLLFILPGCIDKKEFVEHDLGINLPNSVSDIHYAKITLSLDYKTPYDVFISFKSDSAVVQQIIQSLDLVHETPGFETKMCMTMEDDYFLSKQLTFDSWFKDTSASIAWWKPHGADFYASFYRMDSVDKTASCYKSSHDGSIVLQYDGKDSRAYIFIQVMMK